LLYLRTEFSMPAPKPPLRSFIEIARDIATRRQHCNESSVWRTINRLQMQPAQLAVIGRRTFKLYDARQAAKIEASLRAPNARTLTTAATHGA
jgi:hypothetical protein